MTSPLNKIRHDWQVDKRGRDVLTSSLHIEASAEINAFAAKDRAPERQRAERENRDRIERILFGNREEDCGLCKMQPSDKCPCCSRT